jgi:hypothetical protein
MRISVAGWLLGFGALLACSGQNVVAGEEKTQGEKLQASLPSWCASTCSKLSQCEVDEGCDCVDDSCVCRGGVDEDCVEDCQQEMARWAQGSDECAAVGQRFKGCVDEMGCDVLTEEGICPFSEAEQSACPRPGDPDETPPTNSGGPNYGTGGTSSSGPMAYAGTTFTAGSASYDPSATVSCVLGYGSGGGGAAQGWPSLLCEEGHEECSDGHNYLMYCVRTSETVTTCSCLVDQQVVGGFDPGDACPTSQQMNAGCNWNLDIE